MKLIVAIVHADDADQTAKNLSTAGVGVTRLSSSGGFLRQDNATLLIGVDESRIEQVIKLIRDSCRERSRYLTPRLPLSEVSESFMPFPIEVHMGGATIFVLPVDRFEQM
jgi:uncharacterized protein YaaQ